MENWGGEFRVDSLQLTVQKRRVEKRKAKPKTALQETAGVKVWRLYLASIIGFI